MKAVSNRLLFAIAAVIVWAAITMIGGLVQAGPGTSLTELVTERILWGTPAAAAFMLLVAWIFGWRDLGFTMPRTEGIWKVLWLPAIYIAGFFSYGFATATDALTASVIMAVMINTIVVGFSEELAFRGALWGGARKAMAFWPAAILVSVMFGSVHIANGLLTGEFSEAVRQAMMASMSGIAFLALRVRTGSLYPPMIIHWLWDFGLFLMGAGKTIAPVEDGSFVTATLSGMVFVGPFFLFGLYLLRNEKVRAGWLDDHKPVSS